jgi:hypothetical protein
LDSPFIRLVLVGTILLTDEEKKPYSCRAGYLKIVNEIGKACQLQELPACRRRVHNLALEDPCEIVGDEDGVEPGGERWVDVRAGAVADHPRAGRFAGVVSGDTLVGLGVLLVKDLNGGEVAKEAGAVKLAGLLDRITLCDEDQAVAGG